MPRCSALAPHNVLYDTLSTDRETGVHPVPAAASSTLLGFAHIAREGDQQDGRVRKLSGFLTEGGLLDRVQLGPLTPTIIEQI